MNITEVRVKMISDSTERLRAFCSVTLDGAFVIRDLKIIDGTHGPFVAMPSRKLSDRCPRCRSKNHLRARFCNDCGAKLSDNRAPRDAQGRFKLHADVAHPINAACRDELQSAVIAAYREELELSEQPGYRPRNDVVQDDDFFSNETSPQKPAKAPDASAEASAEEDDGGHDDLIAELRQTVARKRGHQHVAPVEKADVIESSREQAEETAAPETQAEQVVRLEEDIPGRGESTQSASTEEEDDFGAGIL